MNKIFLAQMSLRKLLHTRFVFNSFVWKNQSTELYGVKNSLYSCLKEIVIISRPTRGLTDTISRGRLGKGILEPHWRFIRVQSPSFGSAIFHSDAFDLGDEETHAYEGQQTNNVKRTGRGDSYMTCIGFPTFWIPLRLCHTFSHTYYT